MTKTLPPGPEREALRAELRRVARFLYDLQKLRISTGLRDHTMRRGGSPPIQLSEETQAYLGLAAAELAAMEKEAERRLKPKLRQFPAYAWLENQPGCGPRMSAILLGEIDCARAQTASQVWAFAGLAVDSARGRADRRKRGEKARFNPWLKAKRLKVLGECLIKSGAPREASTDKLGRKRKAAPASTWYDIYVGRKHRRQHQKVPKCMGCDGTGKRNVRTTRAELGIVDPRDSKRLPTKKVTCQNCEGTGGPAPWGGDPAHRELDARRVMVKLFLAQFWKESREADGLPVRPSYAEEKLGIVHNA